MARGSDGAESWRAPELEHRRYRADLGIYDTLYYGLMASKAQTAGEAPRFEIWFGSHYGGTKPRHYATAKSDNGSRPLQNLRQATERCQEFANLTSACVYHDSASMVISREQLENAKNLGLKFVLSSGSEDYETIELPAHYVQGFLDAVR